MSADYQVMNDGAVAHISRNRLAGWGVAVTATNVHTVLMYGRY